MDQTIRYKIEDFLTGKEIWKNYLLFKESQWWDAARTEEFRQHKLTSLLRHCYKNVPIYSYLMDQSGVNPDRDSATHILGKIPVIDKQYILDHYEQFIPLNYKSIKGIQKRKTSGTTGQVLNYMNHAGSRSIVWASFLRFKDWMGYSAENPFIVFRGRNFVSETRIDRLRLHIIDLIKNYRTFDAYKIQEQDIERLIKLLKKYPHSVIRGYVLNLVDIAGSLRKRGLTFPVQAVNTTAEPLLGYQRRILEETFICGVFDQYGFGEIGGVAYECDHHEGLHITQEHVIVENDQNGELIITDLDNYCFPFIKYKTGDKAILSDTLCSCGRKSGIIKAIEGRTSDNITGLNGLTLHWGYFHHLLIYTKIAQRRNMIKFQVSQVKPGTLTLKLVSDLLDQEDKKRLTELIREKLGPMEVVINNVSDIPAGDSGKYQAVISGLKNKLR